MATGHSGAQYARTAAGVAAKAPPKFSNGVIAAVSQGWWELLRSGGGASSSCG